MQGEVENIRQMFSKKINKLLIKEILIKIVAGLVKENPQTYNSEEMLDYNTINPTLVFQNLVAHLREINTNVH